MILPFLSNDTATTNIYALSLHDALPISRTAIVQSKPALNLQLSSEQGTVAPGGKFIYTLATANLSGSSLPGTTLKATVLKGASFVSAYSDGVLNAGTVTWGLGAYPVCAT